MVMVLLYARHCYEYLFSGLPDSGSGRGQSLFQEDAKDPNQRDRSVLMFQVE
jgi:hypothetical protein